MRSEEFGLNKRDEVRGSDWMTWLVEPVAERVEVDRRH